VELDLTERYLGPYTVSTGGPALTLDDWSRLAFTEEQRQDPAVSGPDADPDGDGLTNYQEYLAGTSPTAATSALRISGLQRADQGGYTVRWQSADGRVYAIDTAPTLDGPFVPVAGNLVGDPPENAFTDPVDRGPQAFYRIRLVVPE
jgi:hypothetical protein